MPPNFEDIYHAACERKGGKKNLEKLLPGKSSARRLKKLGSDRYLAEFSKKVFQSGFVWRVVEQKWDGFEEVFWDFDIAKLLMMPDDMLERKAQDKRIIRNYRKVLSIRENAMMISDTERQQDTAFGEFIAAWPKDDVVGLWTYLKKNGSRLGGNTGPYALRTLGVDTFLMSRDVEGYLRLHKIVGSGITSQRALKATQNYFNDLRDQSGRSLADLSRIVSFCFGDNWIGVNPPE